ncbi:MAG: response regulator [Nitrospira sp.]|nr:response regulator [Nitrospira sp.]
MTVHRTCVLVVDDEEMVRRLIIEYLEQHSITVVAVEDGLQALRVLHERSFDAVITDLYVPYLDGFDLLCQCRLVWPQLPVILMLGSLVDEIVQLALIEGAAACLPKPVNTRKLIEVLREVIVRPGFLVETTRMT